MPTDMFERIRNQIINNLNIKPKTVVLYGSGFTSDDADKYYSKIGDKERKNFPKCHIAIDVNTRLILCSQAVNGPRHDTKFAITSIRSLKNMTSITSWPTKHGVQTK